MIRLKNTKIGLFPLDKLERTKAFERDLDFYLGKGWMKHYSPRYNPYIIFVYTRYTLVYVYSYTYTLVTFNQ